LIGLLAASTLHLVFMVRCKPALFIVTVCCSIPSWIATRSYSSSLSNSSMHNTPLSANTIAPASMCRLRFSSYTTAAVKPTPELPLPVVLMQLGAMFIMARSSWDLPQPGSPHSKTLMSPLNRLPLSILISLPPNNWSSRAFFTSSLPWMYGQIDLAKFSTIFRSFDSVLISTMSSVSILMVLSEL